jgi:hypothetical protein
MKKTYIALGFLVTGFLLAGNAYGEDDVILDRMIKEAGMFYKMELEK